MIHTEPLLLSTPTSNFKNRREKNLSAYKKKQNSTTQIKKLNYRIDGQKFRFPKQKEDWQDHTDGKKHNQGHIKIFVTKKKATVGQHSRLRGDKISGGRSQANISVNSLVFPPNSIILLPIEGNTGVDSWCL